MKILRVIALLSIIGTATLQGGCAARGRAFLPAEPPASNNALVYIYRPNSIVGGAIRYHVAEGDNRIVYLIRGGYFPYLAEPGEKTFWARTESRAEATQDLHPGETYYLRCGIGMGIGVGRPRMKFVDAETGEKELKKLKLLPAAEPAEE